MRKPLIAGNWKMNKTIPEAVALVRELLIRCRQIADWPEVEVVVCPPFTALHAVSQELQGSLIGLGAQNLHWEASGAYTGEISASMLRDAGCQYVILGHSERRQYFRETDLEVSKKIRAAESQGLVPIVCMGETLAEREDNRTLSVIEGQLRGCLGDWDHAGNRPLVIAYEPVWAIGTGRNATPEQANEVHTFIRDLLRHLFGESVSSQARILYGGSVNPGNIESLLEQPELDGALVGGASLEVESFVPIIEATVRKKRCFIGG
jgi:triosephosphate isomerase